MHFGRIDMPLSDRLITRWEVLWPLLTIAWVALLFVTKPVGVGAVAVVISGGLIGLWIGLATLYRFWAGTAARAAFCGEVQYAEAEAPLHMLPGERAAAKEPLCVSVILDLERFGTAFALFSLANFLLCGLAWLLWDATYDVRRDLFRIMNAFGLTAATGVAYVRREFFDLYADSIVQRKFPLADEPQVRVIWLRHAQVELRRYRMRITRGMQTMDIPLWRLDRPVRFLRAVAAAVGSRTATASATPEVERVGRVPRPSDPQRFPRD